MQKIVLNGMTFDGASVLRAVEQVDLLPCGGEGMTWNPWQIATPEEYLSLIHI